MCRNRFLARYNPSHHCTRTNCRHCNCIAPSQLTALFFPRVLPANPFQCISADFFHYKGKSYLVVVFRYSNWPIMEQAQQGSKGLIDCLQHIFGIPDDCTMDGGPEINHISHMPIPEGLGSTPPSVICSPLTLKLRSRNCHQSCQTTPHQQLRPTRQSKRRCLTACHTPISEHS